MAILGHLQIRSQTTVIEVLRTAIKKGHMIITYCQLTSKGMKRFPFFQLTQTLYPNSARFPLCCFECSQPKCSQSPLQKLSCCTKRIILLHFFFFFFNKNPAFLKHQFGYQNCRCSTYHSMKAMAHGHLKVLQIYAEICLPCWWGACVCWKYSLPKEVKKKKMKGTKLTAYILMGYPQCLHKIHKLH